MSETGMNSSAASIPVQAIAFLSGVCFIQLLPDLSMPLWIDPVLFQLIPKLLLALSLCAYIVSAMRQSPTSKIVSIFIISACWALLSAQSYLFQRLPENLSGEDILIEGFVSGLPHYSEHSVRFNVDVTRYIKVGDNSVPVNMPSTLRLSWYYHTEKIYTGERWQLMVRLKPPHGSQNPGGFDYEKWLYQQSIHATGYVRKHSRNRRLAKAHLSISGLREALLTTLSTLPDKRYQGLLQALTIGHKSAISQPQWDVLRRTGTQHLMAISGLHIGMIAALIFFSVKYIVPASICKVMCSAQIAAYFSLVAGGFYALLAGFSIPTQRAFIMLLIFMLALIVKRPALSINTLGLALIGVLMINPVSVLSAGFWLSFIAVSIIMLVSAARPAGGYSRFNKSLQSIRIQWLIAMGMLPLSFVLFQQGSFISPLANLIAIPLVGLVVVPLALFASLMTAISADAGLWFFALASDCLSIIWLILQWFAELPLSSWQRSSIPVLESMLALSGVFLLLLPKGFPLKYAGILLLLPLILYQYPRPAVGEFRVDIIDVGQGLSVLVQTRDNTLLYDTGARYSDRFDSGRRVIVPYLNYIGIQKIDKLVISHGDNDHAGGADAVLEMLNVEHVLTEAELYKQKFNFLDTAESCHLGQHWRWNGVDFAILHPSTSYYDKQTNNRSCVLKVWNRNHSILLSGDIERRAERHLLQTQAEKLKSDVLIVPHHGSNTSSSLSWIDSVNPELAIVSAGYKNRFGHPTDKIINRYRFQGLELINTASSGMIMLNFPAGLPARPLEIKLQRKVSTHYWNHRL